MSADGGAASPGGFTESESTSGNFYGEFDPKNISKHDRAGNRAFGGYDQETSFSRDYPTSGFNSGECYNCGELGHNKADCPNPAVDRPFSGECNFCGQSGHRKAECPSKPALTCRGCGEEGHIRAQCPTKGPDVCKRCKQEGHVAAQCTNAYDLYSGLNMKLVTKDSDAAWQDVVDACMRKDIDDFKIALLSYCKSTPQITLDSLEETLREENLAFCLVAKEQQIFDTHTIVNLQGKIDCKYAVTFQSSLKPRRAKFAEAYPKTMQENLERLKDAGFVMDRMVPKCNNCGALGHTSRACTEERRAIEKPEINCANCGSKSHYMRDCPAPRVDKDACRNCGQSGHRAADCTEPRNLDNVECRGCGQMGHYSKECPHKEPDLCRNCNGEGHHANECPGERKIICRNCEQEGHFSKDCTEPRDWTKVKCRNCQKFGHGAARCPDPPAEADVEPYGKFSHGRAAGARGMWSSDRAGEQAADTDAPTDDGGWMTVASGTSAHVGW